MATEKDFNVPPYFDDFDETKDFYRILYRPSTAVQARELTQSQTILQKQIERFGNHVFKDGSVVDGVGITYYPNVHFIALADTFNVNTNFSVSEVDSTYLITNSQDSNNAVRGIAAIAKPGIQSNAPSTNRFYVFYTYTGKDLDGDDQNKFSPGDTLYIYNENQAKFGTLDANNLVDSIETLEANGTFNAEGYSYCIQTSDGVIFQKGVFSRVEPHIITVKDFDTNVNNYVVGFNTLESIVTGDQDESLLDNALGYPNENAPGAHRFKLTPTLVSKLRTDTSNSTNFFSIVEFDGQEPTEQKDDPQYNVLERQLARKTYDESGDYVVNPFQIETRVNSSNSQSFYYEVSPGIAYVRGYRIEKIGTSKVEAPRAIETEVSQNQIVTANYGNYVVCDEYLGQFDFEQLSEVTLYDQAQNAISEYEGSLSSPSGSIVGYANIRAVIYSDGTKGSPTAQYYVYLYNIRMNSGKNFSTDVRSLYTDGTFGKAKADVVLENGLAVLKDSNRNFAYFGTGLQSIKRLTNNTGIGDTSFVYNQIKSATMTSNGVITLTIDTAAPGASTERLNSTTGSVLTGSSLDEYSIYLSNTAYSANLSGTVAITTTGLDIIGTSTSFTTELSANANIRIYANSTQTYVRRVVSISNNTLLTVDNPLPQANATANFQQYYVAGTPLPIESITINSNTSFTANVSLPTASIDSGIQTVYCQYPVNRNQATAIPKAVKKSRFVKIDFSNNAANTVGPWNLGIVDVHKIKNIYLGATYSNTNPERSEWFTLDTGQRDSFYDHARLFVKPQYSAQINSSSFMLVELDLFEANTSASVGFFSVESYPIDDANTANTNAIQTIEIPTYRGTDLRNVIDFRAQKFNTANTSATSAADATINPDAANTSFNVPGTGQYFIAPDSNFTADFEVYLPRIDLVTLDSSGNFNVKQGIPSTTPITPLVENDQSAIAECYVPAYPSATKREFELYGPNIESTTINLKTNRRYTMRDIGVLDQRIKTLEYYTVLNILEQQARDLTIPDENGLDRFKNGIFADPFNSHNLGNVGDFEYKIAIDKDEGIARPYFEKHDVDFQFLIANSSNVQQSGPIITLPFDNIQAIRQRYATKIRNTTESVWQWNGLIDLYPSYDFFRDEDIVPNVNVNLDLATPWEQFAQSPFGTIFGDWRTISTAATRNVLSENRTRQQIFNAQGQFAGLRGQRTVQVTSTETQQMAIDRLNVNTLTQEIDLGSYVKDISIQPYMRSRLVSFVAYNMKPNTVLHAFFDDVNVDEHCAPGELSGITEVAAGVEDRFVNRTGNFGDALVSDENGFVCGVFLIPAETFRVGDRVFQLTNVSDLVIGADAKITISKATFTADNIAVTKSSTTINVRQPQLSFSRNFATRNIVTTGVIQEEFVWDPIAQSFSITGVPQGVSGVFLSRVGVYFQSKDPVLGCNLYLCEMENNLPNTSRIIAKAHLDSSSISVSEDATSETIFDLEYPVYLLAENDYCFIVQPDGNSPEYNIWVGETGGFDVNSGEQVYSNPYSGIMFVSANFKTWTAIQKEDIKFNIYRAKFNQTSGYATFKNENDEYITVDGFTKTNTSIAIQVGDIVYTVNSSANTADLSSIVSNTLSTAVSGRIQYFNEADGVLWLDASTANTTTYFSNTTNPTIAIYRSPDPANTSYVNANNLISYANILSVDNLKYHTVVPKFGTLQPSKTAISFDFIGTSNSNVRDTAFKKVINEYDYQFSDTERHAMSRSNEVSSLSSQRSSEFKINMSTEVDLVSPVINLSRKAVLFVENKINNDSTNEHTRYGNALSRYVSKKVVLADGQEAEDLKVYLTAYKPVDTEIEVYCKFWNNQDSQPFDDKVWTKLQYANDGQFVYSSQTNTSDYREFQFLVPSTNSVAYAAFANTGFDIYNPLGGGVTISNNSTTVSAKQHSFNANTGVDGTNDVIAITTANTFFDVGDPVIYNVESGNTAISGLTSGVTYYVSFSNATHIAVSESRSGANINITASSTSETGHYFTGTFFLTDFTVGDRIRVDSGDYFAIRTITNIANNTSLTVDKGLEQSNTSSIYYVFQQSPNDGIVEYTNSDDSRFIGYKEFALKIVLLSSNAVRVPKLSDVRAIALQV